MPFHPSQIERSISRLNETAYGTPRANSDDFRRIISSSRALAQESRAWQDDAGYDNGSDVASDKWQTTLGYGVPFTPDFCFQDIGFFLKDFLGGYAVAGAAAPYIHTFTPQSMSVSRQMPSRTYLENITGLDLTRFTSIVGTRAAVSWGKMGRITTSFQYEASGKRDTNPSGYTSPAVTADREWAYASQIPYLRYFDNAVGTAQVETATALGSITGAGNVAVVVTSANLAGSPITLQVPVAGTETASQWADKVRIALRNNVVIFTRFDVSGSGAAIILTDRVRGANDATLNISLDNGTSTGVTTAATSANTTAGVIGDTQSYTCDMESGTLTIDQPPSDPGYRTCSPYVVADQPRSGQIRSEFYVGARKFGLTFGARLAAGDKTRDWMEKGTVVTLQIPIIGIDANNASLEIVHTRAIIDDAQRVPDLNGFVGINGSLDLMSNSGSFPLTAVLMNDVASYSS